MADLLTTKYHRLQQRNTVHQGFFRIEAYELQRIADHESLTRYVVQRPDATVILLYNQDEDCFYLVKQLRAPALQREPDPYLLELPAGVLEPGEEAEQTIVREAREETGFAIPQPQFVKAFYASPGTFSEKIHAYYSTVTNEMRVEAGGGLATEAEDIELKAIPRLTVYQYMDEGYLVDAKTLVSLYWFRSQDNRN